MKKILTTLACALLGTATIFAGGGSDKNAGSKP